MLLREVTVSWGKHLVKRQIKPPLAIIFCVNQMAINHSHCTAYFLVLWVQTTSKSGFFR